MDLEGLVDSLDGKSNKKGKKQDLSFRWIQGFRATC